MHEWNCTSKQNVTTSAPLTLWALTLRPSQDATLNTEGDPAIQSTTPQPVWKSDNSPSWS